MGKSIKTKSGAKKRFRCSANGVRRWKAGLRHNMRNRSGDAVRGGRFSISVHSSDAARMKSYGLI